MGQQHSQPDPTRTERIVQMGKENQSAAVVSLVVMMFVMYYLAYVALQLVFLAGLGFVAWMILTKKNPDQLLPAPKTEGEMLHHLQNGGDPPRRGSFLANLTAFHEKGHKWLDVQ